MIIGGLWTDRFFATQAIFIFNCCLQIFGWTLETGPSSRSNLSVFPPRKRVTFDMQPGRQTIDGQGCRHSDRHIGDAELWTFYYKNILQAKQKPKTKQQNLRCNLYKQSSDTFLTCNKYIPAVSLFSSSWSCVPSSQSKMGRRGSPTPHYGLALIS